MVSRQEIKAGIKSLNELDVIEEKIKVNGKSKEWLANKFLDAVELLIEMGMEDDITEEIFKLNNALVKELEPENNEEENVLVDEDGVVTDPDEFTDEELELTEEEKEKKEKKEKIKNGDNDEELLKDLKKDVKKLKEEKKKKKILTPRKDSRPWHIAVRIKNGKSLSDCFQDQELLNVFQNQKAWIKANYEKFANNEFEIKE